MIIHVASEMRDELLAAYQKIEQMEKRIEKLRAAIKTHHSIWRDGGECMSECVRLCYTLREDDDEAAK